MKYRRMENIGVDVSALGFGCMRLPILGDDAARIDYQLADRMLHYAIDSGVNYVDTAYPYHKGESERFVGESLSNGYRDRVYLATKMPTWLIQSEADFQRYLDEQLVKLKTDHIDFYLLHGLNKSRWPELLKHGVFDFLESAMMSGKIRFPGFSFHDDIETYKKIIDSYPWAMSQIQLNYMDTHYQAGVEGLEYAQSKDIPLVIMEPLRGGRLATRIPEDIHAIWKSYSEEVSPVEWAFKWVYNFPAVKTVLSGMSTMDHVIANLDIFSRSEPNCLTDEEMTVINQVRDLYKMRIKTPCTNCGYCTPCPSGVDIPQVMAAYNNASIYNLPQGMSFEYDMLLAQGKGADKCTECGRCVPLCPQNIQIPQTIKEAHEHLRK